jgi:hypothetical protein
MPATRTATVVSVLGLVFTALGLWFTYQQYHQKIDPRPALDVTAARVIQRLHLNFDNYVLSGETDRLEITISNRGGVEASNITASDKVYERVRLLFKEAGKTAPQERIPDMPPDAVQVITLMDDAEKGDDFVKTYFRGKR